VIALPSVNGTPDRELRKRLADWEAARSGDLPAAYHQGQLQPYLVGLRSLMEREAGRERAALLAALALGPRGRGLPGAGDIWPLLQIAVDTQVDVLDAAIAWGAGWGRAIWPEHEWHGRWEGAILALGSLVRGSINTTVRWLADNVPDFRDGLGVGGELERSERLDRTANLIAVELALGRCSCGHGAPGQRSPVGSCARREHRLDMWRPDRCRLPAFVATAVRGTTLLPVRAGAFGTSMLSSRLREEELLLVDAALFNVCHECHGQRIRRTARSRRPIQLRELDRGLYDVDRCPSCGRPPHPERTYRVCRKNWLLVPAVWGGRYEAIQRRRCMGCGNLLERDRRECPLCRWQAPRRERLTTVWVRSQ
jgi:hypothetical protein